MMERPYYIDYPPLRLMIHKLVTSKYFDLAISAVIGVNVITMAMEFYMMPPVISYFTVMITFLFFKILEFSLKICNYFFTGMFVCEALMKVYALGLSRYLSER